MRHLLCGALALLALSSTSSAQLVFGHDDTSGGPNAWLVDVCTGTSEVLWSGFEAWGLAVDDTNGKIYIADGSNFGVWDYSQQGTATLPTSIATFMDPTLTTTYVPLGLAWAAGKLYGYRTTNDEIFEIDTTTGICTVVYNATPALSLGGLAYNPADGLFYATNDSSTGSGYGLYSLDVFGVGGDNLVVAYPGGETDIDGLAVGNNRAYLITDDVGDEIYTYDLGTATWIKGATNPIVGSSEIFSAGGWAPSLPLTSVPTTYCLSQVNSQACTPVIASSGTPSVTSTSAFDISVSMVLNNSFGILFYGYDRNEAPFGGGTLCILGTTIKRTPAVSSGGNPPPQDCSGTFSNDFNLVIQGGSDPNLVAGACVYAQYWSRDPGDASGSNLSDAVSFRIEP